MFFSNQNPPRQVHEGMITVPATTIIRDSTVPEPPVCLHINAIDQDVEKTTLGISAQASLLTQNGPVSPAVTAPTELTNTPLSTGAISKHSGTVTPVNVVSLKSGLSGHPNQLFVDKLCSELTEGARIGYSGPRSPRFSKNLPTASENPTIVSNNIAEEVKKGRTAGPFQSPPFENFQVSPIGIVPKKHSEKFRTIFHLSFPKSGTSSVNYFIDKDDFSLQYITIDNAIEAIQKFGRNCFMAKTDIESAFRQFPVHPDD